MQRLTNSLKQAWRNIETGTQPEDTHRAQALATIALAEQQEIANVLAYVQARSVQSRQTEPILDVVAGSLGLPPWVTENNTDYAPAAWPRPGRN